MRQVPDAELFWAAVLFAWLDGFYSWCPAVLCYVYLQSLGLIRLADSIILLNIWFPSEPLGVSFAGPCGFCGGLVEVAQRPQLRLCSFTWVQRGLVLAISVTALCSQCVREDKVSWKELACMIGLRICPWSMFLSFLLQVLLPTCETEALGFPGALQVPWAVWKWQLDASPWLVQPGKPWCRLPALLGMAIKMSQRVGQGQVCWCVVMELSFKACLMEEGNGVEMRDKRNTNSTLWLQKLEVLACLTHLQHVMYWNWAQHFSAWKKLF